MSTITQQPEATVVRGLYAALSAGDMPTITRLFSPDAVMVMPGDSPMSGRFSGRDAILGFFGRMAERSGGTYAAELREVYTGDGQVVAVHHGTAHRGDRHLDADAALLFTVRDGTITGLSVHQKEQGHWDAFFAD